MRSDGQWVKLCSHSPWAPGNPGATFPLDCGAGCWAGRQGFRGQRGASQSLLSLPLPSGRQDSCTVILQKGQPRGKTSLWAYAVPGPCGRGGGWGKLSVLTVAMTSGRFQEVPSVCLSSYPCLRQFDLELSPSKADLPCLPVQSLFH